jgi:peptidyl-prolyl cis-trans isomerase A (cyclophilin A)
MCPALAWAFPANRPTPGYTRVAIETSVGTIVVAVDNKRAPRTAANFLAYVDDDRFDGVTFYRAARRKSDAKLGRAAVAAADPA